VAELKQAIDMYIEDHNDHPWPFIWSASATDILAKVTRAKAAQAAVGRQGQTQVAHWTSQRSDRCGNTVWFYG
jgi:hypothetical protein